MPTVFDDPSHPLALTVTGAGTSAEPTARRSSATSATRPASWLPLTGRDLWADIADLVSGPAAALPLGSGFGAIIGLTVGLRAAELAVASAATAVILLGLSIAVRTAGAPKARTRDILIIGGGPIADAMIAEILSDPSRRVLGFLDTVCPHTVTTTRARHLGPLEALPRLLMDTVVDEVVIALPVKSKYGDIQTVIDACDEAGVACSHPVDLFRRRVPYRRLDRLARLPTVRMLTVDDRPSLVLKRTLDVTLGAILLTLLTPLMLVIALLVKLTSPGPVLFAQERYGYRKRRFRMFKFRTMVRDAEARLREVESLNEASGAAFKIRHDPRLTPIGAILRRWSLDELPQLLNVLRGEMSLVGPRPMSIRDVGLFEEAWLMRRFSVWPGVTCLWQIGGRASLSFDEWMALDMEYIERRSLRLDLRILIMTLPAVLRRSGAM